MKESNLVKGGCVDVMLLESDLELRTDSSTVTVIERVTRDEDPVIKMLTEKTRKLFKEIAYKTASSTIKQALRRWVNIFQTKKLKPIYDLANTMALMENNTENLEETNVKESLVSFTTKNSKFLFENKEFFESF
ncbi:maestro heat-like repeat-containing protein family member 9 [Sigmodon hispidus]